MATSTSAFMLICCFAQRAAMSQHVAVLPTVRWKVCAGRKDSRICFFLAARKGVFDQYLDISNQKRAYRCSRSSYQVSHVSHRRKDARILEHRQDVMHAFSRLSYTPSPWPSKPNGLAFRL